MRRKTSKPQEQMNQPMASWFCRPPGILRRSAILFSNNFLVSIYFAIGRRRALVCTKRARYRISVSLHAESTRWFFRCSRHSENGIRCSGRKEGESHQEPTVMLQIPDVTCADRILRLLQRPQAPRQARQPGQLDGLLAPQRKQKSPWAQFWDNAANSKATLLPSVLIFMCFQVHGKIYTANLYVEYIVSI